MRMDLTENIALALLALLIEALVGYPGWLYRIIGHPVSWIGRLIGLVERRLNLPERGGDMRRERGWGLMIGLCFLVGFGGLSIHLSLAATLPGLALLALIASTLIAQRSLYAHVRDVAVALDRSLEDGRAAVALIVGRNVEELDEAGVRLTGKRSGDTLTLGDRVIVEAIDASLQRRWIELALIDRLRA